MAHFSRKSNLLSNTFLLKISHVEYNACSSVGIRDLFYLVPWKCRGSRRLVSTYHIIRCHIL